MPTVKEIAQVAEVSSSTVSLVLNGRGNIGEVTRQRVEEVAKQMGYQTKSVSHFGKNNRTLNIGIVYGPDVVGDGSFSILARAWINSVRDVLSENSSHLTLFAAGTNVDKDHFFKQVLDNKEIQGAIFIGTRENGNYLNKAIDRKLPVVVFDRFSSRNEFSAIAKDDYGAGRQIAEHLIELGHKKIGILEKRRDVNPIIDTTYFMDRITTFNETLEKQKIESLTINIGNPFSDSLPSTISRACQNILDQGATAIFANGDRLAIECLNALDNLDISVPEQVSVIGFDDVAGKSRGGQIPTSIGFDKIAMGEAAANILLELIEEDGNISALSKVFPTYIVDHGTTGPVREEN